MKIRVTQAAVSCLILAACTFNFETEGAAANHEQIIRRFGIYPDAALEAYVQAVGERIAHSAGHADLQLRFFILDAPEINAFSLPEGSVYVSRGLLALARNEAEMAAVLSHEIAHIAAGHLAPGRSVINPAIHSRRQEREADISGLSYLTRAGYDPRAMANFLESLQAETAMEDNQSHEYFSSHPAVSDRIAEAKAQAGSSGKGKLGEEGYLAAIDGLIYGDSPGQGFVRGRDFYHPELGFAFTVPEGFQIWNTPAQVTATSPSDAVIVFDMIPDRENQPRDYLRLWMKGEQARAPEEFSVNGMASAATGFSGRVGGRPVDIYLAAIRWDADRLARFQISVPRNAIPGLIESLSYVPYSFRRLNDRERAALRPLRIRIVTANPGNTPSFLSEAGTLSDERFRILNGLHPGESIIPGRKYKVISE